MTDQELAALNTRYGSGAVDHKEPLNNDMAEAFGALSKILPEVMRLREELRRARVEICDWEARVRSEREACAKLVEDLTDTDGPAANWTGAALAAAIRARGGK